MICEILSRITVKISFLWGPKHDVYATAAFAASATLWYIRYDMQNFTSVILYMNTICIAQWLSGANSKILHSFPAFAQCQPLSKP